MTCNPVFVGGAPPTIPVEKRRKRRWAVPAIRLSKTAFRINSERHEGVSRRDKLLAKMRTSPGNVRFGEIEALLRHEGFVLFNQRGSHRS